VGEKVKKLRGKIDESLSDEDLGWSGIKTVLSEDIKGGLNELKNKLTELEKSQEEVSVSIPTITVDHEKEEKLEKELVETKGKLVETERELAE
jgi:hypothetical protein